MNGKAGGKDEVEAQRLSDATEGEQRDEEADRNINVMA